MNHFTNRVIMVNSHRRSGTHLLIDALCHNLEQAVFPAHRHLPKDFNIGSLFRQDPNILQVFDETLTRHATVIIKSHLLPEEMDITPSNVYEQRVKDIYDHAQHVYVYRDPRDTLRSLAGLLDDTGDLMTFINTPNDHFVPSRAKSDADSNRTRYWAHHLAAWRDVAKATPEKAKLVRFEDLRQDFQTTMHEVMDFLGEPRQDHYHVPKLPQNQLLHRLMLKAHKWGLVKQVPSSAIRPGKGKVGAAVGLFEGANLEQLRQDIRHYQLEDLISL
jgi:hypothetical protein